MSPDPSRKQFFAKLLGFAAAVSLAPRFFAKSVSPAPVAPTPAPSAAAMPVPVRPETRAVARQTEGS